MDPSTWQDVFTNSQKKRWLKALPGRFSCREFAAPASISQLSALSYAAQAVCPRGIHIALVREGADKLILSLPLFLAFSGLKAYAVILAQQGLPDAHFLAGLAGQALALEMAHLGLQTCFVAANYRRKLADATAQEGQQVMAVLPFGVPQDPEGARARIRKPLTAFCPDDPAAWPLWAYQAAEAVRAAPSAINRQPWQMSYAGNTFSFKPKKPDSMDCGIAICHLLCAAANYPHSLRLGSDGKTFLLTHMEDGQPAKTHTNEEAHP